jgi:hypothetical protein
LQDNTAEKQPKPGRKPQPAPDKEQGISNRNLKEENKRQAKVIPFPEQREQKNDTNRGKK